MGLFATKSFVFNQTVLRRAYTHGRLLDCRSQCVVAYRSYKFICNNTSLLEELASPCIRTKTHVESAIVSWLGSTNSAKSAAGVKIQFVSRFCVYKPPHSRAKTREAFRRRRRMDDFSPSTDMTHLSAELEASPWDCWWRASIFSPARVIGGA